MIATFLFYNGDVMQNEIPFDPAPARLLTGPGPGRVSSLPEPSTVQREFWLDAEKHQSEGVAYYREVARVR